MASNEYFERLGVAATSVATLPSDAREFAARHAGVPTPSATTWRLVVDLLRDREERRCDDPFRGLPGAVA